jgi:hypothetical protein
MYEIRIQSDTYENNNECVGRYTDFATFSVALEQAHKYADAHDAHVVAISNDPQRED